MSTAEKVEQIVRLMGPVLREEGSAVERASQLREVSRLALVAAQELAEEASRAG